MTDLNLVAWGEGESVILVHGNKSPGTTTFAEQKPLSDKYHLILIDRRGYGESPATARADFDVDAQDVVELLGDGAHLVGQSYGGLACLLAAGMEPAKVRSLTVIEPPAFGLVRGQEAVERFIEDIEKAQHQAAPVDSNADKTRRPVDERAPWEANIDVERLAAGKFPKLVVSGGRQNLPEKDRSSARALAFEAVCSLLAQKLGAQRAVIPNAAHSPQTENPRLFNARLRAFLEDATAH